MAKLKEIGALWTKTDQKQREYLSGYVDLGILGQKNIMAFPVKKTGENRPSFTIHILPENKNKEEE